MSSKIPVHSILMILDAPFKIIISQKDSIILKIITQLQIMDIVFMLSAITFMFDRPLIVLTDVPSVVSGNITPTSKADKMWMLHKAQIGALEEKRTLIIPNINDGPALLQKANSLCPSALEI